MDVESAVPGIQADFFSNCARGPRYPRLRLHFYWRGVGVRRVTIVNYDAVHRGKEQCNIAGYYHCRPDKTG